MPLSKLARIRSSPQETEHHSQIYRSHFIEKGGEAAKAAIMIS